MEILLYITIVILIVIIIYLKLTETQKVINIDKQESELKLRLHQLEVQGLQTINQTLAYKQKEMYEQIANIKEKLMQEEENFKSYKQEQLLTIEKDIQLYRQEQINKIKQEVLLLDLAEQNQFKQKQEKDYTQFLIEKGKHEQELGNLIQDLNNLKEQHAATLNIIKEEEKLKNEADFYRITLNQDDIDDIKELNLIEKRLHNKEVLYKLIYKNYIEAPMNNMFARVNITETSGIYKITNINNHLCYIGQSTNVKNRVKAHIQAAIGITAIASQMVHDKMKEEGLENFTFQLIESCEKDQLNIREKYWISYYSSNTYGYNRTVGGAH